MWRLLLAPLLAGLLFSRPAFGNLAQEPPKPEQKTEKAQPAERPETGDDTPPYRPPAASKSVEIANYYFRTKKYQAALSRYQEAVTTDPYCAEGYLGLGKTYEKLGLKQKALADYRKYLDLLPSQKQADEAKAAHKAIGRLEQELKINKPEVKSRE